MNALPPLPPCVSLASPQLKFSLSFVLDHVNGSTIQLALEDNKDGLSINIMSAQLVECCTGHGWGLAARRHVCAAGHGLAERVHIRWLHACEETRRLTTQTLIRINKRCVSLLIVWLRELISGRQVQLNTDLV